jgi:hypothetical protein
VFNTFVFCQSFNEINCRRLESKGGRGRREGERIGRGRERGERERGEREGGRGRKR